MIELAGAELLALTAMVLMDETGGPAWVKKENLKVLKQRLKKVKRARVKKQQASDVIPRSIGLWGPMAEAAKEQLHDMLKVMGYYGAPMVLMQLITMLFMNVGAMDQSLDMVEYFAGEQAVTQIDLRQVFFLGGEFSLNLFFVVYVCFCLPYFCLQVTRAWVANGFRACPYEIRLSEEMDILSDRGLLGLPIDNLKL